jgi:hypothetical protein
LTVRGSIAAGISPSSVRFRRAETDPHRFSIKGKGCDQGHGWLERSKSIRGLWVITTDIVKRTVYDGLNIASPGPGFAHFAGKPGFSLV